MKHPTDSPLSLYFSTYDDPVLEMQPCICTSLWLVSSRNSSLSPDEVYNCTLGLQASTTPDGSSSLDKEVRVDLKVASQRM